MILSHLLKLAIYRQSRKKYMAFPDTQNQALRNQLNAELGRINNDLNSLSTGRTNLINIRNRMRTSHSEYTQVRKRVLSRELTAQIRVQNRFQGQCANILRAHYRATVALLKPREKAVDNIMSGIDFQLIRIDSVRENLQGRRNTIQNQLINLN